MLFASLLFSTLAVKELNIDRFLNFDSARSENQHVQQQNK